MVRGFYTFCLTSFVRRDFFREAAFFLITWVFTALSKSLYACVISFSASPFFPPSASRLISFSISCNACCFARLCTAWRIDCRNAFFADDVFGIL